MATLGHRSPVLLRRDPSAPPPSRDASDSEALCKEVPLCPWRVKGRITYPGICDGVGQQFLLHEYWQLYWYLLDVTWVWMLLKDLKWTPIFRMSSCTVREPMTLQAEHLGIRFYPYPLVYAIGGHAKPSQRREGVEETQTARFFTSLDEAKMIWNDRRSFSKRNQGSRFHHRNFPRMVWITSQQQRRGGALGIMAEIAGSMAVGVWCQVLDVENQCHLALWWMEVMMSLFFRRTSNRSARSRSC